MTDQTTTHQPLTDQQLDDIEERAAAMFEHIDLGNEDAQSEAERLTGRDVPALIAEVRRLQQPRRTLTPTEYDAAWHAIDQAAIENGADPDIVLPAVLAALGIATPDTEPSHVRAARYEAAGNVMAASLARDGFGDDEITDILTRPR